ncbi:RNase MRP subunit [Gnomoniopsis sp. IMI 355080]|nr:RNase MRP subunit [Gnomoniopsis sp. IMI 355080]
MATLIKDKSTSSTPPLAQLHSSLTSLETATHILAGLTHRNKNQHRGTKWWPAFSMLRRSLQKLILDLTAAVQRAEAVGITRAKQRKTPTLVKNAKQPELDRVVERAVWIVAVLGPRAYEAFSQLTADRQFAQLGLVLIGVLAQVEAAMAPFVPVEPPKPGPEETSGSVGAVEGAVALKAVIDSGDLDLGVVVSRDELDDGSRVQPSAEQILSPIPKMLSTKEQHDSDRMKSKKRKKPKIESSETTGTPEVFSVASTAAEKRQKLQPGECKPGTVEPATTKNFDESKESRKSKKPKLDDTLSRTRDDKLKATKKSTKKKKKGGDEFDDLFSSLL